VHDVLIVLRKTRTRKNIPVFFSTRTENTPVFMTYCVYLARDIDRALLKSLHQFLWCSGLPEAARLHSGSVADEHHQVKMPGGILRYRLLSLPLYLASQL
jgi:hypothetical protein